MCGAPLGWGSWVQEESRLRAPRSKSDSALLLLLPQCLPPGSSPEFLPAMEHELRIVKWIKVFPPQAAGHPSFIN